MRITATGPDLPPAFPTLLVGQLAAVHGGIVKVTNDDKPSSDDKSSTDDSSFDKVTGVAGSLVGAYFGGPAGAAIGAPIGKLAGDVLSGLGGAIGL